MFICELNLRDVNLETSKFPFEERQQIDLILLGKCDLQQQVCVNSRGEAAGNYYNVPVVQMEIRLRKVHTEYINTEMTFLQQVNSRNQNASDRRAGIDLKPDLKHIRYQEKLIICTGSAFSDEFDGYLTRLCRCVGFCVPLDTLPVFLSVSPDYRSTPQRLTFHIWLLLVDLSAGKVSPSCSVRRSVSIQGPWSRRAQMETGPF